MPAQPSPARWEDSEAVLGTWSVPQHSPGAVSLAFIVTVGDPASAPGLQPHTALPLASPPVSLPGPAHGDPAARCAATTPVPPPCDPPRAAPGSEKAPGLLPARRSRVCLTWPDKGAAVPRPRRHKAFPVGAGPPRAAAGAGGAGGIPLFRRGWARPPSLSAVPCHAAVFAPCFSGGFTLPKVSPGRWRCLWGITRCAVRCPRPGGGRAVVTVALVTPSAWCCWATSPLPLGTR